LIVLYPGTTGAGKAFYYSGETALVNWIIGTSFLRCANSVLQTPGHCHEICPSIDGFNLSRFIFFAFWHSSCTKPHIFPFSQKSDEVAMTQDTVMTLAAQAMWMTILLSAPLLLSALLVGLLVGMFQAATQINEMTLSFIPKLGILVVALLIFGPWMLGSLVAYTQQLITSIPELIG
jgi:flagellar biosynthesis protein FliQ